MRQQEPGSARQALVLGLAQDAQRLDLGLLAAQQAQASGEEHPLGPLGEAGGDVLGPSPVAQSDAVLELRDEQGRLQVEQVQADLLGRGLAAQRLQLPPQPLELLGRGQGPDPQQVGGAPHDLPGEGRAADLEALDGVDDLR